jgi:hypothetical protein
VALFAENYRVVIPRPDRGIQYSSSGRIIQDYREKIWIPWSSQGMTDFVTLVQVIATQPPGRIMTAFENTAY